MRLPLFLIPHKTVTNGTTTVTRSKTFSPENKNKNKILDMGRTKTMQLLGVVDDSSRGDQGGRKWREIGGEGGALIYLI